MKKIILQSILEKITIGVVIILLLSTLKGALGNPTAKHIYNYLRFAGQPFELSPERNRYSQLLSIWKYQSFTLPLEVARIVVPDLGYINGHYVSLYPPGFTLLATPFFLVGDIVQAAQLFTSLFVLIFGVLSFFLIIQICSVLKINRQISFLCAFLFIFGTNAWAYTSVIYQHLITTAILLGIIRLLLNQSTFIRNTIIWFLFGLLSIIDYPNIIVALPLGILFIISSVIYEKKENSARVSLFFWGIFSAVGIVPILLFFGFMNKVTTGNPFTIAQTAASVENISPEGTPIYRRANQNNIKISFAIDPSRIEQGLNVLLFSSDRGIIWYSPVFLTAFLGIAAALRKNQKLVWVILSIISVFFIYSIWIDPWGGWAFGPRYLIPALGMGSLFLAFALQKILASRLWTGIFLSLGLYSIFISLLGAVTSNQVPPYHEATGLHMKYNFLQNYDYLQKGISGSFLYNEFLQPFISFQIYFVVIYIISLLLFIILTLRAVRALRKEKADI